MTADVDVTVFPGDRTVEALTKVVEAHGFELRGADADFVRDTRVLPLSSEVRGPGRNDGSRRSGRP